MTTNNRTTRESAGGRRAAFTLIEIVAAITVLALIVSSSLVIINNCLAATIDMKMRMAAFELARENMEKLLGATAVPESVDYGDSNEVAGITWETRVEPFYEPHTSQMWLQAVSAASWYDTGGLLKTVEFTHWLTNLSQDDINKILKRNEEQEEALDEYAMAEIRDLLQLAVDAFRAGDYESVVAICRQIMSDYPNSPADTGARVLLRNMPSAERLRFDVKPYETTPPPLTSDSDTPLPDVQPGLDTPDNAVPDDLPEKGPYTEPQLYRLCETDWEKCMQVIMEILSGKSK